MSGHDIIVVGASAGGVEALTQLVSDLPLDLPAAIFVVLHIAPQGTSVLPSILNRSIQKRHKDSPLRAAHPIDGELIEPGKIYVAPPNMHLLIKEDYIRLARGAKENSHRPAIDPLFRTAARVYGQRVVGVVLSGSLDDGTAGLLAVKQQGGIAIVQNLDEALYSGMPRSAIENVDVDHILHVSEIAPILVKLAHQPVKTEAAKAVSKDMEIETDIAELELAAMQSSDRPGKPSPFACPECAGVLWELDEGKGKLLRFRCRTGHAYSVQSLLAEQSQGLEKALWEALRALEEKVALSSRLGKKAREKKQSFSAKRFEDQAQEDQQYALLVRQLLLKGEGNSHLSTVNAQLVSSQIAPKLSSDQANNDFNVVALTASSLGGLKAVSEILSALPADFPAAITIVQPLLPQDSIKLADILTRHTVLEVKQAESGDLLCPGKVYIAPKNKHLLVNADGTLSLSESELVHFVRPSADLLFESVAASFKQRAIAVVLTGIGSDGAMGVQAIKEMGGTTIAQNQETSEVFTMPQAAIASGSIDWVVPLDEIAYTLVNLVKSKNEAS